MKATNLDHGAYRVDSPEGLTAYFDAAAADVFRYVSRLTGGDRALTEDIVQDAFVALVRHAGAAAVTEVQIGWIMTAARNRFIDHVRSRRRESARWEQHGTGEEMELRSPEWRTLSNDQARWLLAKLPDGERWALALHTVDGMSVAEVAAVLQRSTEATTSLLARARRRLRACVVEERT